MSKPDESQRTLLHHVLSRLPPQVTSKQIGNMVKVLVSFDADINFRDKNGETPLHVGVQFAPLTYLLVYIREICATVSEKNNEGVTPLHYFCQRVVKEDDEEEDVDVSLYPFIFRELLRGGVNVNTRTLKGFFLSSLEYLLFLLII